MQDALSRFVREEDGIEIAEWGIAAVLVALAAASTIFDIAAEIVTQLTAVLARLNL